MAIFVNGEPLDPAALENEFQAIKARYESMGRVSCCERDPEFRAMARDNVIARVLLNQEAERRGIVVTDEDVEKSLASLEAEHGGREALLNRLGLHPCQIEEVKADIAKGLKIEKTLLVCLGPEKEPAEDEVLAYYQAHQEDYYTEEEMRASHVIKKVDRVEDRERIYNELRELRRRALAGEDFDALALAHTDKEDKLIDLGWFKQGDFMDEFGTIAFSLEEGEVSPVFSTYFGLHLAKCTGRRPSQLKPFEEVREVVKARLKEETRQNQALALVESLKAAAVIEEREEPVMEGAS